MKTTAMKVFSAYVGVVTVWMLFLLVTGAESCAGRSDPDPRTIPVYVPSSSDDGSGYSGGHSSYHSSGGSSFGK